MITWQMDYEKPLIDFIFCLVPDSTDTESLFQETFFRAVRAKRTYRATAQFKTWLFQIAVNLCWDRTITAPKSRTILRR
jgi:RNA polymerase sigma-70 factor (ECF subfamily)